MFLAKTLCKVGHEFHNKKKKCSYVRMKSNDSVVRSAELKNISASRNYYNMESFQTKYPLLRLHRLRNQEVHS